MKFASNSLETRFLSASELRSKAILLLVHGRGGRLELMEFIAKRAKTISNLDFLLVQAPHPEFVPEMKKPGFSWYLGSEHKGLDESREKIKMLFEELKMFGYESQKIFWIGFSQGGVMGLDYFLRSDEVWGGLACISGFCLRYEDYPDACGKAAWNQRLLATHGRRDEIVKFEYAKKSYDWLRAHKLPLEFKDYNKPHSFDLKEEIPFLLNTLEAWVED